jgi:hypothetical protein
MSPKPSTVLVGWPGLAWLAQATAGSRKRPKLSVTQ